MESLAYLSLGSNVGDSFDNLQQALLLLQETDGIMITCASSIYKTEPVGFTEQAKFLNLAVEVMTELSPEKLLQACRGIEEELGRKRLTRWGPRTIDLDILLYNAEQIETDSLTIPHARMHERSFVLIPLLEMNPFMIHPVLNESLRMIQQSIGDEEGVELWKKNKSKRFSGLFE
ncbi:2-amino-4-hydroxy-6-hydroxymethyldihydropteridine diphosphokinase [Jeotgalibacillus proteolyticus]|uniref:2-amino-4-hydroxy-6-hydroxymethyldihydropteridine diphosphokinase n=1 Tax=Jeotgalibacillus proteolyticus TaxID=2082395 RepID=A0A2S5G6F8_9BACL|nr:2-amino-4-hydroxy-6-hydroxymethyldihydropteridine diphosphokinase [Jeotgalibacillus proteolyticus]PPA68562.1 2-amino-4-hydroxy-6-hydroxymethyldihydropteridine diphosphokinase [Jeotgalibacillus proteolyticus]